MEITVIIMLVAFNCGMIVGVMLAKAHTIY